MRDKPFSIDLVGVLSLAIFLKNTFFISPWLDYSETRGITEDPTDNCFVVLLKSQLCEVQY